MRLFGRDPFGLASPWLSRNLWNLVYQARAGSSSTFVCSICGAWSLLVKGPMQLTTGKGGLALLAYVTLEAGLMESRMCPVYIACHDLPTCSVYTCESDTIKVIYRQTISLEIDLFRHIHARLERSPQSCVCVPAHARWSYP